MTWYYVRAQGRHGYPQPEEGYQKLVYADVCLRCGVHGKQAAPFRLKRSERAAHSGFLQLNWVFDAFFARPEIAEDLSKAGITGISFGPVLDHATGDKLDDRVQILIPRVVACAETSHLQTVTCRAHNEESGLPRGRMKSSRLLYCGAIKHHPPTSLALERAIPPEAPDLFQTAEWFGSGGSAFRLTLGSERFVNNVEKRGWRGLAFDAAKEQGWSNRAGSIRGDPKVN